MVLVIEGTVNMSIDPENLYRRLGRLIEAMPDLNCQPTTTETHQWLGQSYALVKETGNIADAALLTIAVTQLMTAAWEHAVHDITAIVFRALATAELNAPPGVGGAFIPVGNSFEAFSAISRLLKTAKVDVLIVDPYMDETALTEFGIAIRENVKLRLLSDKAHFYPTLQPAASKWIEQHGDKRPLEVRIAHAKSLHDRAIFIDKTVAWTITQSLKNLAGRSPAEIIRADDTASLKIEAYEEIWNRSKPMDS